MDFWTPSAFPEARMTFSIFGPLVGEIKAQGEAWVSAVAGCLPARDEDTPLLMMPSSQPPPPPTHTHTHTHTDFARTAPAQYSLSAESSLQLIWQSHLFKLARQTPGQRASLIRGSESCEAFFGAQGSLALTPLSFWSIWLCLALLLNFSVAPC